MYGKVIAKSPLVALFHRNGLFKATPNPQTLQISGWASANRVSLRSQLVNLSEHGFSTFFQNDDILPQRSFSLPTLAPTATHWMLVVGVGAHPVGCLIRQLAQRSVPLQARHELAHRLQPSVGHKPQQLHLMSKQFGAVEQTNYPTCFVPLECNEF